MALSAQHIAALRSAQIAAGLTTSVSIVVYQNGSPLSAFPCVVQVTEDETQEIREEDPHHQMTVRRIGVRPQAAPTQVVRLGDKLTYDSVQFTVIQIQGASKPKWVCEYIVPIGVSAKDRFRAVGA